MRKRIQVDYSGVKLITDQSAAKELTMASIVKKLEKGIMPNLVQGLVYTTDLGVRNLQDVVERQSQINNLFYQLPTELRALMHNDISNFEDVIFNPENASLLEKYGFITKQNNDHKELLHAIKSIAPHLNTPPNEQK